MSQRNEPVGGSAKKTPAGEPSGKGVNPHHAALLSKIESGTVRVGIIGLGYVGLPLARAFTDRGIAVLGFDVDPVKVAKLEQGQSYIGHISDADDPPDGRAALRGHDIVRLGSTSRMSSSSAFRLR